jgi:hypothetical protein
MSTSAGPHRDLSDPDILEDSAPVRSRVRADDDLTKVSRRDRGSTTRLVDASTTYIAGVSEAMADGWREFSDTGPSDRMFEPTARNGWLQSTVASYAVYFDRLASTAREVLADLQTPRRDEHVEVRTERAYPAVTSAEVAAEVVASLRSDPEFIAALVLAVEHASQAEKPAPDDTTP